MGSDEDDETIERYNREVIDSLGKLHVSDFVYTDNSPVNSLL